AAQRSHKAIGSGLSRFGQTRALEEQRVVKRHVVASALIGSGRQALQVEAAALQGVQVGLQERFTQRLNRNGGRAAQAVARNRLPLEERLAVKGTRGVPGRRTASELGQVQAVALHGERELVS